jgi:hypothetical protein
MRSSTSSAVDGITINASTTSAAKIGLNRILISAPSREEVPTDEKCFGIIALR